MSPPDVSLNFLIYGSNSMLSKKSIQIIFDLEGRPLVGLDSQAGGVLDVPAVELVLRIAFISDSRMKIDESIAMM